VCLSMETILATANKQQTASGIMGSMAFSKNPIQLEKTSEAKFDAFFREEYLSMVSLARMVSGDSNLGEDLAQDAFRRAHENWDRIQEFDRPGAWVRRVTINLATSKKKKVAREAIKLVRLATDTKPYTDPPTIKDPLWALVSQLPAKQRAAVVLHYQDDFAVKDIAKILECTESTTRSHLHKARKTLQKTIGEQNER